MHVQLLFTEVEDAIISTSSTSLKHTLKESLQYNIIFYQKQ